MENKDILPTKHRKNKSTFDNSLSFDIKSNFRPQTKYIQHKNYNSSLYDFKNEITNKLNVTENRPKSNIRTFQRIKNENPSLDCYKDKFNMSHLNAEELRKEKAKTPLIVRNKNLNESRNYKTNYETKINFAGKNDEFNKNFLG